MVLTLSLCSCTKELGISRKNEATSQSTNTTTTSGTEKTDGSETAGPETDEVVSGLTPIYDNTAVISAYESKDTSSLDEKQLAVYNAAVSAIAEFYTDEMSDEEIILAAHDWIVTHTTYDENMLLAVPKQSPDTENPYGLLISHQAICMGYTTTFQLFMDMLGVESVIVRGSSDGEEHAWNMVNLDGEWYHVDVTWDDFIPDPDNRPPLHLYCFVTDELMKIKHVWDPDTVPEATDDSKVYFKTHGKYAATKEEAEALLNEAYNIGLTYAEIMYDASAKRELNKFKENDIVSFAHAYQYWLNDFNDYIVIIYWLS